MDLRTFRRNGPGLAECESEAAWRRLWGDRRAHRSLDTRGPVSNVAASWPQFGYRGADPFNVVRGARGKSLWLPSLASRGPGGGPRRCHDGVCSPPLLISPPHPFAGPSPFLPPG